MPHFLELYRRALNNYIHQTPRTHHTQRIEAEHRIYTFGWLSFFRHSQTEYPSLVALRMKLEADHLPQQTIAKSAIIDHFNDDDHKWNNHSFNNYLLDEIYQSVDINEWHNTWLIYDKNPVVYYQGILFRGTGTHPIYAFKNGLVEKTYSENLEDYIHSVNGAIGVSTSKLFRIAQHYALPNIDPRRDYIKSWDESYIYVIHYQGNRGVDLEQTFKARQRFIETYLSSIENGKAEVNVIGHIDSQDIVGAFYVNRSDKIEWHANPRFDESKLNELWPELFKKIPKEFLQCHPEKRFLRRGIS